jgi:hypothetical protein
MGDAAHEGDEREREREREREQTENRKVLTPTKVLDSRL